MVHPENILNALPGAGVHPQTILDALPPAGGGRPQRVLDASPIGNPLPLNVRDAQETVAGQLPDNLLDALPVGQNPYQQITRPDRNNSAGLPGIDWSCSAGGTNGEAMTDDVGPDLPGNTYLRWTGNLGTTTWTGNLTQTSLPTLNTNGWVLKFTARTSDLTNSRFFIHLRNALGPVNIQRDMGAPNYVFSVPTWILTSSFAVYQFTLTPAEAAQMDFTSRPWHIQLDFSGIPNAGIWDWAQFELDIPPP